MLDELLENAQQFYKAGHLQRAERACRQILEQDKGSTKAWFLLGLISCQANQDESACDAFSRVLNLEPANPEAHNNLGISLVRRKRLEQAIASFGEAIRLRLDYAEPHNNLGNVLREQGEIARAVEHYQLAIGISPRYAEAHNNLGIAYSRQDQWADAAASYRRAVEANPKYAEAHNNIGIALARLKRFEEAVASFELALSLRPTYAEAQCNRGIALTQQGLWDEAVPAFRQAITLRPDFQAAHQRLGNALAVQKNWPEAILCLRQAVALDPKCADAWRDLGKAQFSSGDFASAIESFRSGVDLQPHSSELHSRLGRALAEVRRFAAAQVHLARAIELNPKDTQAHLARAKINLICGEMALGFREYEWAWRGPNNASQKPIQPHWQGEDLRGGRILIHADTNTADTLQFIRYAKQLKELGATVLLQTSSPLQELLANCPFVDEVNSDDLTLPECDFQSTLLNLPKAFGTTLATIPAGKPYLFADVAKSERWKHDLNRLTGFRIGICWQGNESRQDDPGCSIPLAHFAPLAAIDGARLISLQQGMETDQTRGGSFAVDELGRRFESEPDALAELAAVIANLDLVVTTDSSVAHLSGALGKPIWLVLSPRAHWRWLLQREDSPWYPTMRIFRQSEDDAWDPIFKRISAALTELLARNQDLDSIRPKLPATPTTWESLNATGVQLAQRGRLDEALAHFRQAIQLFPRAPELHNNLGNALQNQNRLAEAEASLRQALALREDYPEAHNNLGIVLNRRKEFADAERAFNRAIGLKPDYVGAFNNLGMLFLDQGLHARAESRFRRAIELKPDFASAFQNLGLALADRGKVDEAVIAFRESLRLDPRMADAENNLGNALREQGKLAESVECFERAIKLKPQFADAFNNLGITKARFGKHEEAIQHYEEAIRLRSNYPAAFNNLGIALVHQGERAKAIASYRRALQMHPKYAEAHNNIAIVLTQEGYFDEALEQYKRALEFKSKYPEAHSNLGIALTELGNSDEALTHFNQAIALREDYPDAYMNRALTHLMVGDFERGWADYEWRWKCKDFNPRNFSQPQWKGEPLDGRRLLIHTEQGLGDSFQFLRYALLAKQRGGTILVRAPKPLLRILKLCPYIDGVFLEGGELPRFDTHIPLLSMPKVFGTTVDSIPAAEPYLFASTAAIEKWRKELSYIQAYKVGINWQGNPKYRGDRRRSIPLAHFAALAEVDGARLISLQKGFGSEQVRQVPFLVTDLSGQLDEAAGPFMDSAAVMKNLDLFVTSDTSLAHLAGGLGIPVWLALPYAPDWRWMLNREDCPWYAKMRLFRQSKFDDWESVFERMARQLRSLIAEKVSRKPLVTDLSLGEIIDRWAELTTKRWKETPRQLSSQIEAQLISLESSWRRVLSATGIQDVHCDFLTVHEELGDIARRIAECENGQQSDSVYIDLLKKDRDCRRRLSGLITALDARADFSSLSSGTLKPPL